MMQPEGRPQQGKLKTKKDDIHATGTDPCGLGMMQPEGRSQLNELGKCHLDEGELGKLKVRGKGVALHESPGP